MPQRRNLLQPEGSHRRHRAMPKSIQHDPTALILELSAASTPNIHSPIASAGSELPDAIVSMPLVQNIRQVSLLARRPAALQRSPPVHPPFRCISRVFSTGVRALTDAPVSEERHHSQQTK